MRIIFDLVVTQILKLVSQIYFLSMHAWRGSVILCILFFLFLNNKATPNWTLIIRIIISYPSLFFFIFRFIFLHYGPPLFYFLSFQISFLLSLLHVKVCSYMEVSCPELKLNLLLPNKWKVFIPTKNKSMSLNLKSTPFLSFS